MKSISKSVPVWRSDCCLHPAEKLESMCVVHVRASCGEARLKKKKKKPTNQDAKYAQLISLYSSQGLAYLNVNLGVLR